MSESLKIVGIAGSLRKQSYNRQLLKIAGELLPKEVEFVIADISAIPLFNEDLENDLPGPVVDLKQTVQSADAVLFATPEYNGSISGVLKNVIDWLTRPRGQSSVSGKPAGIIGGTTGMFGAVNAQMHLRHILSLLNMYVIPQPLVLVSQIQNKLDAQGHLTDATAQQFLQQHLDRLVQAAKRIKIEN
ncbi:NAD(P)H-dependent oxidoreductase [Alicyclobacillus tolerans]|uniref:NADPH-dependent FMN reductase n=1 Tax=Alicyclobacillus tolerans TaxID=90970 RepID=UPI001F2E17F1|nr:NAD(P)H-dependent oxidoreductase [Alicyclobacillus tolerans]MCF8565061.1 NAD(P)H-dependent oxidoreductase [Alicyclobacillus tolerans]